jgi:hypothetical protein
MTRCPRSLLPVFSLVDTKQRFIAILWRHAVTVVTFGPGGQ